MLLINILGLLLIGLIIWWFWLYKPEEVSTYEQNIIVIVENGTYSPSRIKIPNEQPVTVSFLRKDESPCAATLQIPLLEISQDLPLNKIIRLKLPGLEKGQYPFHCQMKMYQGIFFVE